MNILIFHRKEKNLDAIISKLQKDGHKVFPTDNILDAAALILEEALDFKINIAIVIKDNIQILGGLDLSVWAITERDHFFYRIQAEKRLAKSPQHSTLKFISPPPIVGELEDQETIEKIGQHIAEIRPKLYG